MAVRNQGLQYVGVDARQVAQDDVVFRIFDLDDRCGGCSVAGLPDEFIDLAGLVLGRRSRILDSFRLEWKDGTWAEEKGGSRIISIVRRAEVAQR